MQYKIIYLLKIWIIYWCAICWLLWEKKCQYSVMITAWNEICQQKHLYLQSFCCTTIQYDRKQINLHNEYFVRLLFLWLSNTHLESFTGNPSNIKWKNSITIRIWCMYACPEQKCIVSHRGIIGRVQNFIFTSLHFTIRPNKITF